jgi:hypothetical protein
LGTGKKTLIRGILFASAEKNFSRIKSGESLHTWEVHHTALATALAKGLVAVTDDCRIKLPSDSDAEVNVLPIKQSA